MYPGRGRSSTKRIVSSKAHPDWSAS
jgi:hypothetical protein